MSGFSNVHVEDEDPWNNDGKFYTVEGDNAFYQDQLNFQQFDQSNQYPPGIGSMYSYSKQPQPQSFMESPPMHYADNTYPPDLQAMSGASYLAHENEETDEPPLMEELGIDPDRIFEKTLAVLNPFRRLGPTDDANFLLSDSDLAGPLVFCLALGACLLFGGKVHFGYVYGLAVICCLMMYCLLSLMSSTASVVTLSSVTSILGYCILPLVALSALGIFWSLRGTPGLILAIIAVAWSSLSASRLFVTMMSGDGQRPLIAYPCALLYGVFAIIAIF